MDFLEQLLQGGIGSGLLKLWLGRCVLDDWVWIKKFGGYRKNIEKATRLSRQALGEIVEKEPQESGVFILTKMLRPYFHVIRVVSSKLKKIRLSMQLHSR